MTAVLCPQRTAPEEKASVGPWLLALFIFVVCGSGKRAGRRGRAGALGDAPGTACGDSPRDAPRRVPRAPLGHPTSRSLAAIFQIIQSIRMGM